MSRVIKLAILFIVAVVALYAACVYRATVAQELLVDTDGDGCSDAEELAYGMDPANPYDFLDVPPKDGAVSVGDVVKIVGRFGLTVGYPDYYTGFDRSSQDGVIGPPDGVVAVTDIFLAVSQFGRTCTDVEWCGGNVRDGPPLDETDMTPDPGGVVEETCYRIMDETGQVVDYLIVEDDPGLVEYEGEESLSELPEDLPDVQTISLARAKAGLPEVEEQTAAAPRITFWSYSRCKTWKDGFRIPLYKICLYTRLKMLVNAGIYTGAINVYDQWGTHNAWAPWRIEDARPISKVYVYTETGPWDFVILNRKSVFMTGGIPTPWGYIVLGTAWMHAQRNIQGDTDGYPNSYWRTWRN